MDDDIPAETCFCCICAAPCGLGRNESVSLDGAKVSLRPECNGTLCIECAQLVHDEYRECLRHAGVCEHGVAEGDWCPDCNRAYKEAARRFEEQHGCGGGI